jgi:crotonobetainyl-CoA:carnitine CoA-transferase CaiB-like acyl-CoA transferase
VKLPLEGIRVVEVAHFVAVPATGALFADLGADVVKIEPPPRGEIYRLSRPKYAGYDSDFPESPAFHMENRGKRCMALDLRRPEAREAVLRLLDGADVFLTNLLPARRRKYGLDHETLLRRFPRLIMGAINGYGLGGAEGDRPAFDYAAYWARTGLMDTMRDEGVAPSLQRPGVGDHAAGMNLACGILAALRLRDATGEGRYVETSLLQTGLHVFGNDVAMALVTGQAVRRHDRRAPANPLWNSYEVKDGRWLLLVMIEADRYWERFCHALGRADLLADARFQGFFERARHSADLVAELEATFRTRTLAEWAGVLDEAALIWSPVRRLDEAIHDPQAEAMGYFYEIEHAEAGKFRTVAPPFRIEGMALGARRAATPLGQEARRILAEAGLSAQEIDSLLVSTA